MQSAGADILRVAVYLADKYGLEIITTVHDAIMIEAPLERIDRDAALLQEIMIRAGRIGDEHECGRPSQPVESAEDRAWWSSICPVAIPMNSPDAAMPERRLRLKEADTVGARNHALPPTLDPGHADTISIETDGLAAEDVAQRIVNELRI
jgi:hypothetical protein